jgi:hypothetical protein
MTQNGMHILHPTNTWPNTPIKSIRLWDCGVTWKDVNPARGVFNFNRLDSLVKLAEDMGVEHIVLVLGMTPKWAARNPDSHHYAPWIGPGSNSAPHTMLDWTNYVSKVVKRYKGRIHAYQIWNEPQLRDFWEVNEYAALGHMTKLAYQIIKETDKNADVVAAAILPRPSSGGIKRGLRYWRELKKRRWPVDVLSCHVYPESGKGPGRFNILVKKVKSAARVLRSPVKRLWITETNYNVPLGPTVHDPAQISWLINKTNNVVERNGIERMYWYGWGHTEAWRFGLDFHDGSHAGNMIAPYLR